MDRMTLQELEDEAHEYIARMFGEGQAGERLVVEGDRTEEMNRLLHDNRQKMFFEICERFRKYVVGEARREERYQKMEEALRTSLRTYSNVGIDSTTHPSVT